MERLSFSNISYHQLTSLVAIREEVDDSQFNEWLIHDPVTDEDTNGFLLSLSSRHRKNIDGYSEEEVKAKLIIPILNRIDFTVGPYTDWYERPLAATIGGVEIAGVVDYLVARGEKEPITPYFFIQEFKPQYPNRSPEVQLVTEMLVAMTLSMESSELRGAYVHGSVWKFVLLRRVDGGYVYFVSPILDLFRMPDAKSIYVALTKIREQLAGAGGEVQRVEGGVSRSLRC